MAIRFDRLLEWWREPLLPKTAFHVARGHLCGLRQSSRGMRSATPAVNPLPAGVIAPSFDRPNILDETVFLRILKEAARRLGAADGAVSVLLPETCVNTFRLAFDALPPVAEERDRLIRWRLAKMLPLKESDLRFSFDVFRSDGRSTVFCALAAAAVVKEFEQAFAKAGFRVRMIGLPTLNLLGLVPRNGASNILIVNVEDDHTTLMAVSGGETAFFRVKSFPAEGESVWDAAAAEAETTIHVLEDREHRRIESVWVRAAASESPEDGIEAFKARLSAPVTAFSFNAPAVAAARDRFLLAPLVGQIS